MSPSTDEGLRPLPNAIGVFSQFIAYQNTTLVLKEKIMSFSGDDVHIKDASNGMSVLRVRGKTMSMSSRKEVSDAQGHHLFTIRKELLTILSSYYCEDPAGNRFLDVQGKWSFVKPKSVITFVNTAGDKKPVKLSMKGNMTASKADITVEGTGDIVARIHRDRGNLRDILADKQTYYVTVAPGFDLAAATAVCICLDESRHDCSGGFDGGDGGGGGGGGDGGGGGGGGGGG